MTTGPLLSPSTMVTGADFSPTTPGICLLLLQCCHLINEGERGMGG